MMPARNAYLVAFHAAQAFDLRADGEGREEPPRGHTEFNRLAKDEPRINLDVRRFLPQAYNLKAVADQEMSQNSEVPLKSGRSGHRQC